MEKKVPSLKRPAMTIKESQRFVDEWIITQGVRYFNVLTNMAMLTEEVGEVARVIALLEDHFHVPGHRLAALTDRDLD